MANAARDSNRVPTLIGVSSVDLVTPTRIAVNPITGAMLISNAGGGGGGAATTLAVAQTAHGFAVWDVIRNNGADTYTKAKADSVADAEVVGIVTTVTDADNFTYTTEGIVTSRVPVATAGTVYFIDPSTAGALNATENTN